MAAFTIARAYISIPRFAMSQPQPVSLGLERSLAPHVLCSIGTLIVALLLCCARCLPTSLVGAAAYVELWPAAHALTRRRVSVHPVVHVWLGLGGAFVRVVRGLVAQPAAVSRERKRRPAAHR